MRGLANVAAATIVLSAACVPADHALPLGSVEFTMKAAPLVNGGRTEDGWIITIDRALLSFKSMLIGRQDHSDTCSYRGRAALRNVVFDARRGNEQTFNGISPVECPDVGMLFGVPDDATVAGAGATAADIVSLVEAPSAHGILEASAKRLAPGSTDTYRVVIRLETDATSSRFGGCTAQRRGILIKPNARLDVSLALMADAFFRRGFTPDSKRGFEPFALADDLGDGDHVATMKELDALPLTSVRSHTNNPFYVLDPAAGRSFGDYVREQFKSAFKYEEIGTCDGKLPGALE